MSDKSWMRIALLTHQWPSCRMGGIGSYVRQCAEALAAAGHEPHVFTLTLEADGGDVPAGVVLHTVADMARRVAGGSLDPAAAAALGAGGEGVYRLGIAWLLCDAFREAHRCEPFDVVEAPEVEALGLPLLLDAVRDVPVVTHLHCCSAIARAANGLAAPGLAEQLIHGLEFAAIKLADGCCAPTRSIVTATAGLTDLDAGAVEIIPHPYRCPPAAPPPPAGGPAVFVGRIERLKGCAVLSEALNLVLARNPAARFRFVGPDTATSPGGRSMQQFIQQTLTPAVADRVEFLGQLSRAEVEGELRRASFCVQPSVCENFSLACCEAMGMGRALIVCAGTGSAEVVGDGGIVVPAGAAMELASAMERLYRDSDLAAELGSRARQRIAGLCDPIAVSTRRVEFYGRVIQRFRSRGERRAGAAGGSTAIAAIDGLSRMTAALLGIEDRGIADSPGLRLRDVFRQLAGDGAAGVLLYGAGKYTARLLAERDVWEREGHRVVGIIDDHPRFAANPDYLGLPVRSLAEVETAALGGERLPTVVLSTDTYQDQFWAQTATLRGMVVRVARLEPTAPTAARADMQKAG